MKPENKSWVFHKVGSGQFCIRYYKFIVPVCIIENSNVCCEEICEECYYCAEF